MHPQRQAASSSTRSGITKKGTAVPNTVMLATKAPPSTVAAFLDASSSSSAPRSQPQPPAPPQPGTRPLSRVLLSTLRPAILEKLRLIGFCFDDVVAMMELSENGWSEHLWDDWIATSGLCDDHELRFETLEGTREGSTAVPLNLYLGSSPPTLNRPFPCPASSAIQALGSHFSAPRIAGLSGHTAFSLDVWIASVSLTLRSGSRYFISIRSSARVLLVIRAAYGTLDSHFFDIRFGFCIDLDSSFARVRVSPDFLSCSPFLMPLVNASWCRSVVTSCPLCRGTGSRLQAWVSKPYYHLQAVRELLLSQA
ncbi:hypothetical protein DFP72DRAFT_1108365 [Ephemerocybe angulata]|uniref:Uncharacterized protein n=1 Tax=Ephemerocybe angulata TaxID=980116 RepID=A0A8H6IHB1_9AGAR|nr:hypothetical protein DFP72DRAFT_1108365 [Tulosesus angulatus]